MAKDLRIIVAGWQFHQAALASLLWDENDEYKATKKELIEEYDAGDGDRFYQYAPESCDLGIVHEPDNPHDPAALKVFADGNFIGYVPRGNLKNLELVLSKPNVRYSVEVYGGKFKYLEYDGDDDYLGTYEPKYYNVCQDESPYKAMMVFEWD